jgi:diadenosine tetraphosphatase ApaH/serine/threonine PP2A family protein phosphatase
MKVAILSDIHSNIDALEAVIKDAQGWGASKYLITGDLVGYGANPNECINLLKELATYSIAGNHDWGVIEKTRINHFNYIAREAVIWTRKNLSAESRRYLEDLTLTLTQGEISLSHANFTHPESWEYVFTIHQARGEFEGFSTRMGVIGHSHIPFVVCSSAQEGLTDQMIKQPVKLNNDNRYLVNAGSVGQPRDGDPRACYLRVDLKAQAFTIRRVEYDVGAAQRRIISAGLPQFLAERLKAAV